MDEEKGKGMKVLLIGGSGFVSGTLARTALAAGHEVWAVTRGQRPLAEGVHAIQADRADRAGFARAVEQAGVRWDLAVDCIGYQADDARQDLEVLPGRAGHLVFISTDFVFDPTRRRFPGRETDQAFTDAPYGAGKRACEQVLEAAGPAPGGMAWTVLRPCHIYGPGSQLGCLPMHSRDSGLIDRLRAGRPLHLVGGGHFLQQPVLARDLARACLSCAGKERAAGQIFQIAGPDIIESRTYYRILADLLGVNLEVEEIPVEPYLWQHPEHLPFLCHRFYDLSKLQAAGLEAPATPIADGLREHLDSLLALRA